MSLFSRATFCMGALVYALSGNIAQAEVFPTKPVRITLPFAAGNGADIVTRVVAEELGKIWGQNVIVDNRPGASGIIAMQEVVKAPADGYHYALGDTGSLVVNRHIFDSLPYNAEKDFTIVTDILSTPWGFYVSKNAAFQSIAELTAYAKKNPGKLTYGTGGKGAPNSMALGLLKHRLGIDILEVPYKSNAGIYPDVAEGRIDLMAGSLATVQAYRDRFTALAIASSEREAIAPEIPTLTEETGIPDFEILAWAMLMAPTGTPEHIVEKVRKDIGQVFASTEIRARLEKMGLRPGGTQDVSKLKALLESDDTRYGEVVAAEKAAAK